MSSPKLTSLLESIETLLESNTYGSVSGNKYGTGFLHKDGRYMDVGTYYTHDDFVWENWKKLGMETEPTGDYATDDAFEYGWLRVARSGSTLYVGDEDVYDVSPWESSLVELLREVKPIKEVVHDTSTIMSRDSFN